MLFVVIVILHGKRSNVLGKYYLGKKNSPSKSQ